MDFNKKGSRPENLTEAQQFCEIILKHILKNEPHKLEAATLKENRAKPQVVFAAFSYLEKACAAYLLGFFDKREMKQYQTYHEKYVAADQAQENEAACFYNSDRADGPVPVSDPRNVYASYDDVAGYASVQGVDLPLTFKQFMFLEEFDADCMLQALFYWNDWEPENSRQSFDLEQMPEATDWARCGDVVEIEYIFLKNLMYMEAGEFFDMPQSMKSQIDILIQNRLLVDLNAISDQASELLVNPARMLQIQSSANSLKKYLPMHTEIPLHERLKIIQDMTTTVDELIDSKHAIKSPELAETVKIWFQVCTQNITGKPPEHINYQSILKTLENPNQLGEANSK